MAALVVPQKDSLDADLKRFLGQVVEAINLLERPQGPTNGFAVAAVANLPAASADYANTLAVITSLGAVAVCTLKTGSWAWTRADGSSL
jgi:hypothetical protein